MSDNRSVPLTRELLEALMNVAGVLLDQAVGNEPSPGRAEEAARELADACAVLVSACGDSLLVDACTAALASDAGTPEGERVEGWTGKPCPCPNCGAIRNERDAHFCSSTRAASAPLAESGAAAPPTNAPEISTSLVDAAPDAELDRLISEYYRETVKYGDNPGPHAFARLSEARSAIHAHVEQVKREARAEGERAATGEVVGTGRLHRTRPSGVNHGCELVSFEFAAGVEMAHGGRYAVTLVLRRDKEGV